MVVHPDLWLLIALQRFTGLRFCQMVSSPLSLIRLGNFVVIFMPLKQEQINCIFFPRSIFKMKPGPCLKTALLEKCTIQTKCAAPRTAQKLARRRRGDRGGEKEEMRCLEHMPWGCLLCQSRGSAKQLFVTHTVPVTRWLNQMSNVLVPSSRKVHWVMPEGPSLRRSHSVSSSG